MSIQFAQAGGAGTASAGAAMLDAWAGLPITITAPVGESYLHRIKELTGGGAPPELTNKNAQTATLAAPVAGTRYLIESSWKTPAGAQKVRRIVCVSRDAVGLLLNTFIPPVNNEAAGDADPLTGRGIAQVWERFAAIGNQNVLSRVVEVPDGGALVWGAANLVDGPTAIMPDPASAPLSRMLVRKAPGAAATVTISAAAGTINGEGSIVLASDAVELVSFGGDAFSGPMTTTTIKRWTPEEIPGAYFWAKGFAGRSGDVIENGIPGGYPATRTAGTPDWTTGPALNGKPFPLRMDANTSIGAPFGGPVGNAPHCAVILTSGSDATPFTGFVRAGAVGQAGGVGLTTSGQFGGGLLAGEGVPRVDSPPEAKADGALRMVHIQHRPNYGVLTVGIDGRAPQNPGTSAWAYAKTLNLDGSWAFGNLEAGRAPNGSPIYDVLLSTQEVSAGDLARLAEYWTEEYHLPTQAPRVLVLGDSLADPGPIAPATTNWPALAQTTINAQLTAESRTPITTDNLALSGKMLNALVWAAGSPNVVRQADGLFNTWVPSGPQGIQRSAPYSRSGRREYEIVAGGIATNDICNVTVNRTGAQVIDDLKYVFTRLRSHTYDGIVWSTIPAGSLAAGYFEGAREGYRVQVNDWLRGGAISDGFIDDLGDFDAAGLLWNVTYYGAGPDPLHQNDAGKTLMAAVMSAAILRVIRALDP